MNDGNESKLAGFMEGYIIINPHASANDMIEKFDGLEEWSTERVFYILDILKKDGKVLRDKEFKVDTSGPGISKFATYIIEPNYARTRIM